MRYYGEQTETVLADQGHGDLAVVRRVVADQGHAVQATTYTDDFGQPHQRVTIRDRDGNLEADGRAPFEQPGQAERAAYADWLLLGDDDAF